MSVIAVEVNTSAYINIRGVRPIPPDMTHPRIRGRGTPQHAPAPGELARVILFGSEARCAGWIEELAGGPISVQIARTVAHILAALIDDPPPRPQVLIAEFDALTPGEIMELHGLREQGWFGTLILAGDVPGALRSSLKVEHVLGPREHVRDVVGALDHAKQTRRIARIVSG